MIMIIYILFVVEVLTMNSQSGGLTAITEKKTMFTRLFYDFLKEIKKLPESLQEI